MSKLVMIAVLGIVLALAGTTVIGVSGELAFARGNSQGGNNQDGNSQGGNNQDGNSQGNNGGAGTGTGGTVHHNFNNQQYQN
jgi:hypothetical protein